MMTSLYPPNQIENRMADFQVINILDYNMIQTQTWYLGEGENRKSGNRVVIRGIPNLSNDSFQRERALNRLRATLDGKFVGLKSAKVVDANTIECDVLIDNVNVANYFVDYLKPL